MKRKVFIMDEECQNGLPSYKMARHIHMLSKYAELRPSDCFLEDDTGKFFVCPCGSTFPVYDKRMRNHADSCPTLRAVYHGARLLSGLPVA